MSTSARKSSSQSRIPILPASLGPAWGMTPTGSALLTPRTKTYVAVVRGGLDIRVGGRRSRVQLKAAERSEQEKVVPKDLKTLQKEAAEMFPAFGRDKWKTPPPSRERMEKESRGRRVKEVPEWYATLTAEPEFVEQESVTREHPAATLKIWDIRAYNVPDADYKEGSGSSDPFVSLTVLDGPRAEPLCVDGVELEIQTPDLEDVTDPHWPEERTLRLPRGRRDGVPTLRCVLWDKDFTNDNDAIGIGKIKLPINMADGSAEGEVIRRKLVGQKVGKGPVLPDSQLSFKYDLIVDVDPPPGEEAATAASKSASPQGAPSGSRRASPTRELSADGADERTQEEGTGGEEAAEGGGEGEGEGEGGAGGATSAEGEGAGAGAGDGEAGAGGETPAAAVPSAEEAAVPMLPAAAAEAPAAEEGSPDRKPRRKKHHHSARSVKKRGDFLTTKHDHRLAGAAFLHGLADHPHAGQLNDGFLDALQSLRFEHARLHLPERPPVADRGQGLVYTSSAPVLPSIGRTKTAGGGSPPAKQPA